MRQTSCWIWIVFSHNVFDKSPILLRNKLLWAHFRKSDTTELVNLAFINQPVPIFISGRPEGRAQSKYKFCIHYRNRTKTNASELEVLVNVVTLSISCLPR